MPYNLPEQLGRSLPQIALDVHMTTTGSYERSDKDQQADIELLGYKMDHWEPTENKKDLAFDRAVLNLIGLAWVETELKRTEHYELSNM
jgi:hypothetical protein